MKKTMVALFLFGVVVAAMPASAAGKEWLLGKWELFYDPEGNEKDWVEFSNGGEVTSIAATGRRIPGIYTVSDSEVKVTLSYKGLAIPIRFQYTPERNQLLLYSEKTGNTSVYEKAK